MPNTYTLLNHTADLKIRVNGTDPADLFKNAGLALFDQITMPDRLEPRDEVELSVAGDDRADLMVNFLRELLYLWTGKEQLVKTIDIAQISATTVSARVSMERYQPERHEIIHEIKAITYHQIEVSRTAEDWQAMVVFDV
jgi:SHS2 domain-containing protein